MDPADPVGIAAPIMDPSDLMLAYGTLRAGVPPYDEFDLPARETVRAGVRVPGWLFDLGAYPAARLDLAALRGERPVTAKFVADVVRFGLDRPVDEALATFDEYEDVDPDSSPNIYRRLLVPLAGLVGLTDDSAGVGADLAGRWAWIYEWVGSIEDLPEVPSGDWLSR